MPRIDSEDYRYYSMSEEKFSYIDPDGNSQTSSLFAGQKETFPIRVELIVSTDLGAVGSNSFNIIRNEFYNCSKFSYFETVDGRDAGGGDTEYYRFVMFTDEAFFTQTWQLSFPPMVEAIQQAGVNHFFLSKNGPLSKYFIS